MKREQAVIDQRHAKMLELINEKKEVKVEDLARIFDVSLMTVRRDLQILEREGLVVRYRGGARARLINENDKLSEHEVYRQAIAYYAAGLIRDRMNIYINGSMTALNVLNFMEARNTTIYTNNVKAAVQAYQELATIVLTGGKVKENTMFGDFALRNLLTTQADIAFLGCSGISDQGEILCNLPSELSINEYMLSHCRRFYILADSSKVGKQSMHASFSLSNGGTVITDEKANPKLLESIIQQGLHVIVVNDQGRAVYASQNTDEGPDWNQRN